jgi:hypothetical protein
VDGLTIAGLVALLLVLGGLWIAGNARYRRRRRAEGADWEQAADRPDLWTSGARCPSCRSSGGLLELDGDQLWFECLSCGRRHPRQSRG